MPYSDQIVSRDNIWEQLRYKAHKMYDNILFSATWEPQVDG